MNPLTHSDLNSGSVSMAISPQVDIFNFLMDLTRSVLLRPVVYLAVFDNDHSLFTNRYSFLN